MSLSLEVCPLGLRWGLSDGILADGVGVSEGWVMRLGLQVLGKLHTGFSGCNGKALLLLESVDGVVLTGTESRPEAHRE